MAAKIKHILMVIGAVTVGLVILSGLFWGGAAWERGRQPKIMAPIPTVVPPVTATPAPVPVPQQQPPQTIIVQPQPQQPAQIVINNIINGQPASASSSTSPIYEVLNGDFKARVYDSGSWYVGSFKESTIDHSWGSGGPNGRTDDFWVKWEGKFSVPDSADYRFKVVADGGIQLFVDDYLLIDKKSAASQSVVEYTETINLPAGTHELVLKYYETTGDATCRLLYRRN